MMSTTGLESSENTKVPTAPHEQPHAVYWQTSRRPGRRARYATVNRRLLGATKGATPLYVRAGWRGLLASRNKNAAREAQNRRTASPRQPPHRQLPIGRKRRSPNPQTTTSAHGPADIIT